MSLGLFENMSAQMAGFMILTIATAAAACRIAVCSRTAVRRIFTDFMCLGKQIVCRIFANSTRPRTSIIHILPPIAVICICAAINASPVSAAEAFELHLLDVGQGQSVLVESDGHYMLIDGGGRESSSFVVSYLQQQGITSLDLLAVSHYDEDHMSGTIGALHVFPVSQILLPSYAGEGDLYQSFATAALSSGADIIHPQPGDSFQLGGAAIQVVGPIRSDYELENDRSLALRISYWETSCLVCGDAEYQSETDMSGSGIELASDIYVVNHHGSSSSTSDYFLDTVTPSYALISCGSGNAYGHPTLETLQRLQTRGINMLRTDKQGTIILSSDGNTYWFNQEPCQDWTPGTNPEYGTALASDADSDSGTPLDSDADSDSGTALDSDANSNSGTALDSDTNSESGTALVSDADGLSPEELAARGLEASQDTDGTSDSPAASDPSGTSDTSDSSGTSDASDTTTGDYTYVCNVNTRKFHYPSCNSVNQMNESNRMYTSLSRDELIAQGYEPCGNCQP